MANPLQLGSMLIDWMDPEKAVYVSSSNVCGDPIHIFTEKCLAVGGTIVFTSIWLPT